MFSLKTNPKGHFFVIVQAQYKLLLCAQHTLDSKDLKCNHKLYEAL